jgi:hypothetical protein
VLPRDFRRRFDTFPIWPTGDSIRMRGFSSGAMFCPWRRMIGGGEESDWKLTLLNWKGVEGALGVCCVMKEMGVN